MKKTPPDKWVEHDFRGGGCVVTEGVQEAHQPRPLVASHRNWFRVTSGRFIARRRIRGELGTQP